VVGWRCGELDPEASKASRFPVDVLDRDAQHRMIVRRALRVRRTSDRLEHQRPVEQAEILVSAELELRVGPRRVRRIRRGQPDDLPVEPERRREVCDEEPEVGNDHCLPLLGE
jgi:hypothetical protein